MRELPPDMHDWPPSVIPLVYLCGGINGLSDSDAEDWRDYAKTRLPRTLDPMRRDYRGREAENAAAIVHGDITDISQCNVVLAMCPRPSWGTGMEIFYARHIGRAVFSVVPVGVPVSPWLAYHSIVSASLDQAINRIAERTREGVPK